MVPVPNENRPRSDAPSWLRSLLGAGGPTIGVSYALRAAASASLALATFHLLGAEAGIWAVVSALVVIQPDESTSVGAALQRVIANLVGVAVGLVCAWLLGRWPPLALAVGVAMVAALCRTLRIDVAARSACVALAIVLLKGPSEALGSSRLRVFGVLTGCGVALLVSVVAAQIERRTAPANPT